MEDITVNIWLKQPSGVIAQFLKCRFTQEQWTLLSNDWKNFCNSNVNSITGGSYACSTVELQSSASSRSITERYIPHMILLNFADVAMIG